MTLPRTTIALTLGLLVTASLAPASPTQPQATDLTAVFHAALPRIQNLRAYEIGGVVLLRGRARDQATAEQAGVVAQNLGYTRVANLVQIVAAPDDEAIERIAERELALHRSLDGCTFHVESEDGVLTVAGDVHEDLQKDLAVAVLRSIDGVKEVHAELVRR
jgi:osmotically-inducible protein OsmY